MNRASVILLLVSTDFLDSDYSCGVEMKRALERQSANEACVIPILVRPVDWENAPFKHLSVLPTDAKSIALWCNQDEAFTDVAQGIRRAIEDLIHIPKPVPSISLSKIWHIPYARNRFFTGREELLNQLHVQLTKEGNSDVSTTTIAALTQPQAIKGLGGMGKTQIAIEYAYRYSDRYSVVLWVHAATEETLITSFVAIADILPSLLGKNEIDQKKIVEAVKRWLGQCNERWLLVFDNADDIALVRDFLPKTGKGHIVLTTRAHAVGSIAAASIEVEKMGLMEGSCLLLRRAYSLTYASDEEVFERVSVKNVNEAGNIVIALDALPLALD